MSRAEDPRETGKMRSALARLVPGLWRPVALHDFPGGIHPPENKAISNGSPIAPGPLPEQLVLPLGMHIGAPATPRVSQGDTVRKGQMIADPKGAVSAAIHAPTSGTVVAIGPRPIQHPSGLDAPCIVIEPDGKDTWVEHAGLHDYTRLNPAEVVERIRQAGIAGLGGAGFPTGIKVNLGDHQRVEQLIINAVECEPYITADDRLMRERAADIVTGIQIIQYLLNPRDTLVGVEDNKPQAIQALKDASRGCDMHIHAVPTKYPSGGEKQLIQVLTGKEVDSGSLPAQVGVACQNVGTAYAIKRAIVDGEPLISRITTLTGNAVKRPGNYEVLLGTPVSELLHHAGINNPESLGRLVMGGPMMGFTVHNPAVPVVKTSNCLIAATPEELPEPPPEQPCIRCGACADVCPANLLPQQLYWYAKHDELERTQQHNLMDCIECGACAYVCPSHIPLVQYYRYAKGEIRHQAAEQEKADRARERFEARQARIEQEKAEKEARRQARLEANRKKKQQATQPGPADADMAALKQASLDASQAYKAAVKAAREAQAQDAPKAEQLRAQADQLKATADQAKAAVRDAKAGGGAPSQDPLNDLKKQVAQASSAYKKAVKVAKAAEEQQAEDAVDKRAEADRLKAKADKVKAALRDARANAPATTPPAPPAADPLATLKKQVGAAASAYKAALKAARDAQANNAGNATALQAEADQYKARADALKAELRQAKQKPDPAGSGPATPSKSGERNDQNAPASPAASPEPAAKRQKKLNGLKNAYKMAHKQYKDAHAALRRSERAEHPDPEALLAMQNKVDKLKAKADNARDALNALMEDAKADLRARTGKDLKTLKLEAARAETALRRKANELKEQRDNASEDTLEALNGELKAREEDAHVARKALKQAVEEQGLVE